jgi:hypothetical protein
LVLPLAAPAPRGSALYALKEAGKRMADALNLHVVAGQSFGRWVAVRLEDGSSDGVLYDSRGDAIRHQVHETQCWYEALKPASYTADECALTLAYARAAYDSGWRNPPSAPIKPQRIEDMFGKLAQLRHHARR